MLEAEDLGPDRAETLEGAAMRSPNLHFNPQGGPIGIRGITSLGISGGVDRQPAVGLFVDEVYLARPMGYPQLTWGLDRVEVVRGSQALLYGKNTIGGAVNLVLSTPDGSQGGKAYVGAGSDGARRAGLSWRTPLSQDLAIGASFAWAGSEGCIRNQSDGRPVSDTDLASARFVLAGTFGNGTRNAAERRLRPGRRRWRAVVCAPRHGERLRDRSRFHPRERGHHQRPRIALRPRFRRGRADLDHRLARP
ncbi:TonB-dependent receptor plug domain-containing protein [Pseudogemmobacter sonorensis]|uniref:TonB-dependent receptor plug domain-containing protein n=1 Tax=Pseudogemmobacter sonorensis TaxID=2989681 RepID=UPI003698BD52